MTEDPKFQSQSAWERYLKRKAAAQQEGFTGRFWSSRDYQPKGTKPVWYNRSVENPNIVYWKPDELARYRADMPGAKFDTTKEQQSYWDDPKAVGHWYDFLSVQDDDYVPPDWMDVDSIKSLYKELKNFNDSEDWRSWKPLPFGSMANYQAQMMPYPYGVNPNKPTMSRTESLYTKRLPTIMGNLAEAIDQYNVNITELQKQDAVTYKNYLTSLEPLKQYNLTMERIKEIDPEMYEELGGQIDVNKLSEADFQMPTTADNLPDYGSMEKWAQFMLAFTSAGEMKNRPKGTRMFAAGIQGLMAGVASGSLAAGATAPIATALAIPSSGVSLLIPVVGFLVGTAVGLAQYQSAISGVNNPVLQKPMRLLGILDEWTEQIIGAGGIVAYQLSSGLSLSERKLLAEQGYSKQEIDAIAEQKKLTDPAKKLSEIDFGAAWKAGQLSYESGSFNAGDWLTDFVSKTANVINPEWSSGLTTGAGQVWQLHKGLDTPQNTEYWGAHTLNLVQEEISKLGKDATTEEVDLILAKWIDRYGYSGNLNNFLGQLLISPTNYVPAAVNAVLAKSAPKLSKYYYAKANMADDFVSQVKYTSTAKMLDNIPKTAKIGNPITDAMPMGVQTVFENILTGKRLGGIKIGGDTFAEFWKGTPSPFNVITMATAMKNVGWELGIANAIDTAKFPLMDADGNMVTKGAIVRETITSKDPDYIIKGDDGIEYHASKTGDEITKATKDGADVVLDKPLKTSIDTDLKVIVDNLIKDSTLKRDIDEYQRVLEEAPVAKIPERLRDTSVVKTLSRLANLTPAAQASQTARYAMQAISQIVFLGGGDAKKSVDLIRYMADRIDLPKVTDAASQFKSGNIMAHAIRVFQEYTKPGGSLDDMTKLYGAGTPRRMELNGLAKRLNMSVTDMVKDMTATEVWEAIRKIDPEMANAKPVQTIADMMKPYQGKNPLPLTDAEFVSRLVVDMLEKSEKFLVQHYDIKPLSGASRMSSVLKSALGLGVITPNIPVWISNFLTNEVCIGLFIGSDVITPNTKIDNYFADVGMSSSGLAGEQFGLAADIVKGVGDIYTAQNPPNAFTSKLLRGVQAFNKKLGKFGSLYGNIESFAKKRAFYGAFKEAMQLELGDMLPEVYKALSDNLSAGEMKAVGRAVNNALNAGQIENALGQSITYRPLTEDAIEQALRDVSGGDPDRLAAINDLLLNTEVGDYIRNIASTAKTPAELQSFKTELYNLLVRQAKVKLGVEILAKVEEIRNNPEGAINLINVMGEEGINEFSTMIHVNNMWEKAIKAMDAANARGDNALAQQIFADTRATASYIYQEMFSWQKSIMRAAIEKAGVGEYADRMVIILDTLSKENSKFFSDLDDMHAKQWENKDITIDYDKLIKSRSTEWRDGQEARLKEQAELWVEMLTKSEGSTNGLKGDELKVTAQKFMDEYLKKRNELRKLVDGYYDNRTTVKSVEDYNFWTEKYQAKVIEIQKMFMDGYYDKFFRIKRTKETGTPNAVTPRTPTQVAIDQLRANIIRIESLPEAKNAHQWALDTSEKAVLERMVQAGTKLSPEQQKAWDKLQNKQLELPFEKPRFVDTKEFKQWFADSKVVDANGKPLVVYHGTDTPGFTKFIPEAHNRYHDVKASFFSSSGEVASTYATGDMAGVYPVYLSLKNPLIIDGLNRATNTPNALTTILSEGKIQEAMQSNVYDGIIVNNTSDFGSTPFPDVGATSVYIAFYPEQIKSMFGDSIDTKFDIGTSIADVMKLAIDQQQGAAIDLAKKLFALKDATTDEALIKRIDAALVTLNDVVKTPEGVEQTEQPAITKYPLASQPQAIPTSRGLIEVINGQLEPIVSRIFDNLERTLDQNKEVTFKIGDKVLDSGLLKAQAERWKTDLQMKVATATEYAKLMTDSALLNYAEKTGMDMLLQHVFPFHFWYTHSIGEWAKHILAKPSIYATYAKWQQLKDRNGLKLPSRMAGKLRIPVPFLPDWAGDAMFINPLAKFFPIEALMQPLSNLADLSKTVNDQVISQINAMVRAQLITPQQAEEAIQSGQGQIWDSALATVQTQNPDTLDPMSAVSWSMQPAPWFTIPYYALTGQSEKNSLYPLTRQGQAWAAQGRNIGGVGGGILETVGELLSMPEVKIREIAGLSPYGEFGDYYVEFMLSNMATEPGVDTDAVIRAMLEKKGDLWEQAKQRADEYLSYRMPGSAMMQVIASGDLEYLAPAFLVTAFPAGLYPVGELKQRGLYNTYQQAWDKFVMGDTEAMKNFYNENPEYEARLALFKEPEERLHSHLINLVWDGYTALSDPDKKLVQEQFGESFKTYFLDTQTRNYEKVDNDTLAYWGRQLKQQVPETPETQGALTRTLEPMEMYKPDVAQSAQTFLDLRKQQFPNYYWMQNLYYAIPEGDRAAFLKGFPELKNYWDWKDKYIEANPLVGVYLDDQKARYVGSDATDYAWALAEQPNEDLIKGFDAELALAVGMYALGNPLSEGAKAELNRIWTGLGRPGGNFDLWLRAYLGM